MEVKKGYQLTYGWNKNVTNKYSRTENVNSLRCIKIRRNKQNYVLINKKYNKRKTSKLVCTAHKVYLLYVLAMTS